MSFRGTGGLASTSIWVHPAFVVKGFPFVLIHFNLNKKEEKSGHKSKSFPRLDIAASPQANGIYTIASGPYTHTYIYLSTHITHIHRRQHTQQWANHRS